MKLRRLHIAGAFIMLSWFASLGWLVKRQYYSNGYPVGVTTSNRLAPGTRFYAVYADGIQVGTASLSADTVAGGGARIVTRFDIGVGDSLRSRMQTLSVTPALVLTEWDATTSGGTAPIAVHGARGSDRLFRATLTANNDTIRSVQLEPGRALPLLAATLRASLNAALTPGDTIALPVLDPFSATMEQVHLQAIPAQAPIIFADSAALDARSGKWVAALMDTMPALLLVQPGGNSPLRLWLDSEGFPLRAELPDGLVLERTAFEIANLNFRNGDRPAGPRIRLRPHLIGANDPVLAEDTSATLVFPARDSALASLLSGATSGAATRADTVAALARWISRRIKLTGGSDDAIATLGARSGSRVGQARLFVAAARRAGIPARLAFGVRRSGDSWSPATLPQAYLGQWHSADLVRGRVSPDSAVRLLRPRTNGYPFEYDALLASFMRRPE
ncbi:MAG TPA: transglutaminase-like domain-containing protein [Gemmatimonadales bacterium]|nr:transglutaminase-like domain-containing protein [Gemmatimonadales bacterium]